jgi:hypothetical protein
MAQRRHQHTSEWGNTPGSDLGLFGSSTEYYGDDVVEETQFEASQFQSYSRTGISRIGQPQLQPNLQMQRHHALVQNARCDESQDDYCGSEGEGSPILYSNSGDARNNSRHGVNGRGIAIANEFGDSNNDHFNRYINEDNHEADNFDNDDVDRHNDNGNDDNDEGGGNDNIDEDGAETDNGDVQVTGEAGRNNDAVVQQEEIIDASIKFTLEKMNMPTFDEMTAFVDGHKKEGGRMDWTGIGKNLYYYVCATAGHHVSSAMALDKGEVYWKALADKVVEILQQWPIKDQFNIWSES